MIKKAMRWFQGRKDEEFWDSQMDDKEFDPEGVGAAQRGEVEAVAGQKSRPGEGDDRGGYELVKEMRWRLAVVRFKLGWDVDAKVSCETGAVNMLRMAWLIRLDFQQIHMNEYLKEKDLECLKENWQGWNNIGLALIDRKLHDKALFIFEELWEGLLVSLQSCLSTVSGDEVAGEPGADTVVECPFLNRMKLKSWIQLGLLALESVVWRPRTQKELSLPLR